MWYPYTQNYLQDKIVWEFSPIDIFAIKITTRTNNTTISTQPKAKLVNAIWNLNIRHDKCSTNLFKNPMEKIIVIAWSKWKHMNKANIWK